MNERGTRKKTGKKKKVCEGCFEDRRKWTEWGKINIDVGVRGMGREGRMGINIRKGFIKLVGEL